MAKVVDVGVRLTTSSLRTGLKVARGMIKSWATQVGTITRDIFSFATAGGLLNMLGRLRRGMMDFGQSSLRAAANLEQVAVAYGTLTGNAETASRLMEDIRSLAERSPLRRMDLAQQGQLLLSFGIAAEEVVPTLSKLGDISMGNAQRFKQLALAFAQSKSAGRALGQDMLQMTNAGFNPLLLVMQRTGETYSDLRKRMERGELPFEEIAQAVDDATAAGGRWYQGMERGAQTMMGKWGILLDYIERIQVVLGTAVFDLFGSNFENVLQKAKDLAGELEMALEAGTLKDTLIGYMRVAAAEFEILLIKAADKFKEALVSGVKGYFSWVGSNIKEALVASTDAMLAQSFENMSPEQQAQVVQAYNAGVPTVFNHLFDKDTRDKSGTAQQRAEQKAEDARADLRKTQEETAAHKYRQWMQKYNRGLWGPDSDYGKFMRDNPSGSARRRPALRDMDINSRAMPLNPIGVAGTALAISEVGRAAMGDALREQLEGVQAARAEGMQALTGLRPNADAMTRIGGGGFVDMARTGDHAAKLVMQGRKLNTMVAAIKKKLESIGEPTMKE